MKIAFKKKLILLWACVPAGLMFAGQETVLPAPISESEHTAWHATAWYGKPLVYTKIVPADGSPVKAFSGTTLERWDVCGGLYDLLADENGRGIVFNLNDVPAGKYVLSWKRQARPDGGNADYCVRIKGDETKIAEKLYAAPERTQEQGPQKIQFYFELKDCFSKLAIAFDPSGAGTKGALVGGFEIGVPVKLLSVDFVPAGTRALFCRGNKRVGLEWVL